jgi:hypothetical protein
MFVMWRSRFGFVVFGAAESLVWTGEIGAPTTSTSSALDLVASGTSELFLASIVSSVTIAVVPVAAPVAVAAVAASPSSLVTLRLFLLDARRDNNDFRSGLLPSSSTDLRLSSFSAFSTALRSFSAALRSSFSFLATAFSSSVDWLVDVQIVMHGN